MLFNKERSLQVMEEAGIDALVAGTPANVIYMTAYMAESILDRFYECMAVGIMPCRADALPTLVTEDETDEMIELVSMMPSDPNVGKTATVPVDSEGYIKGDYRPGEPMFVFGEFDMPYLTQRPNWINNIRTYDKLGYHYIAESVDEILKDGELTPQQRAVKAFRENALKNFDQNIVGATASALVEMGLADKKLAFDNLRLAMLMKEKYLPDLNFVDGYDIFRRVRFVKTEAELAIMREGADIHDRAFEACMAKTRGRVNWSECVQAYKDEITARGGKWQGERGIIFGPAHMSCQVYPDTDYVLRHGDAIVFDGLATYKQYSCDLARTGVIGEPTKDQVRLYEAVRAADSRLDEILRPGLNTNDLRDDLFKTLEEAGGDPKTCLILPHPIGIDVFEFPRSYGGETDGFVVEAGMTMNVEILQIAPAHGGAFHIEDTIVVREDGIERFGNLPKELYVFEDA